MIRLLLPLLLPACAASTHLDEQGLCVDTEGLSPVDYDELVAIDGYIDSTATLEATGVASSQEAYDALQAQVGALPAVDFDTHRVAWASAYVSSTCGLRLDGYSVTSTGTSAPPHLHVDVTDISGTCDAVCDAMGGALVVVAVETSQTPTVCRAQTNTCE